MSPYQFTKLWFNQCGMNETVLHDVVKNLREEQHVLEIGCFEGMSSVFFAKYLLQHPESSMSCVDPFTDIEDNDHAEFLSRDQEKRFLHNISVCPNSSKIKVFRMTSDEFFAQNKEKFTFVYIDGCPRTEAVRKDMNNALNALVPGGIMWMDDFRGGEDDRLKKVMVDFFMKNVHRVRIVHKDYQLALQKL